MLNDKMIKEILKNGGATLDVNYNNFNASTFEYRTAPLMWAPKVNI